MILLKKSDILINISLLMERGAVILGEDGRKGTVTKLTDTPFLNLYEIDAADRKGKKFSYFFASRRGQEELKINTGKNEPEGVTVFAVTEESPRRLLLIEEYRYPLGAAVYDVPAGMIDAGEDGMQAAVREVKEETGMHLEICRQMQLFSENAAYMTPGMTDESNVTVFGYVTGKADSKYQEDEEDICVRLLKKEDVKVIIKNKRVTTRALYAMMLFLAMEEENPFGVFIGDQFE